MINIDAEFVNQLEEKIKQGWVLMELVNIHETPQKELENRKLRCATSSPRVSHASPQEIARMTSEQVEEMNKFKQDAKDELMAILVQEIVLDLEMNVIQQ